MNAQIDAVVVGAGMAGLCAAVAAAEAGQTVTVIEKGTRPGGSMALSHGFIWTFKEMHQLRSEMPDGDRELQELVVEQCADGRDWLQRQGVRLSPEEAFAGFGWGQLMEPAQLIQALLGRAADLGVTIRLRTPMRELIVEDGRVCGVRVRTEEQVESIEADRVILTTGGFQGNAELLRRYVTPYAEDMYLRANPWSTGDGLLAALAAGAALTPHLGTFYGHAVVAPPARFGPLQLLEATQRYGPWSVALNLNGARFTDESAGTGEEWLNQQIARQPRATAVYVLDAAISEMSPGAIGLPITRVIIDRARAFGGPVVTAPTLEQLCQVLGRWGIPPDRALDSIIRFNQQLHSNDGSGLSPARIGSRFEIKTPPFTAVLVRAGITFTCGGLAVDAAMRVLEQASTNSLLPLVTARAEEFVWSHIDGLYAAGSDVGGLSNSGYLGGLASALVTGRLAGTCQVG